MNTAVPAVRKAGPSRAGTPVIARGLLAGVTALTGLLAVPSAAQAAGAPRPASSAAAVCDGVSSKQIEGVLGFSVPTAVVSTSTSTFDKKLGITEHSTVCTYGTPTSIASMQHEVVMLYATLSKAPSRTVLIPSLKAQLAKAAKNMPKGSKESYAFTTVSGVPSLWWKIQASEGPISFTFEYSIGWQGTKVAGGWVASSQPQSNVEGLEKLALSNFGM